jgi:hypothetical protein
MSLFSSLLQVLQSPLRYILAILSVAIAVLLSLDAHASTPLTASDSLNAAMPKPTTLHCEEPLMVRSRYQNIYFGETANFSVANETKTPATWRVLPTTGVSKSAGKGDNADNLKFAVPGAYKVVFEVLDLEDAHTHSDTAYIEVAAVKMQFLTNQIVVSKPIAKGVSTENITIKVPAEVVMYDKAALLYTPEPTTTTGVFGIKATLTQPNITLKAGKNILTYTLSGTPQAQGKAQLGFFNSVGEGFFYNFEVE